MSASMSDLRKRMDGAISTLQSEFSGLRTGRASASLLEHVVVDAYGSNMPLNQVANITVPEPRMINVQVWDKEMVKAVEKAITNASLGLNPSADGQTVRVPVPELSEERRKELQKVAGKYAENTRVAIRNVRRDGMDDVKKAEKESEISKDDAKRDSDEIQKITDEYVKKVDDMLAAKEKDIMVV